jgi:hypothetical protein
VVQQSDHTKAGRFGRRALALVASAAALMWGSTADATTITKGPDSGTMVYGYYGANPDTQFGFGQWQQEIGPNPPFGTTQMDVQRVGADVVINITTPFNINVGDSNSPAQAADIAISTNSDGVYDLGIALGQQVKSIGLYSVSQWQTSRDLWTSQTNFVYGGQWTNDQSCRGSTDANCGAAKDANTQISDGSQLDNAVTVSQGDNLITVDVANLAIDQFDLLWGTGDCGNDTAAGHVNLAADVPEPTSLAVFCVGLLGAGLAARRRRRSV